MKCRKRRNIGSGLLRKEIKRNGFAMEPGIRKIEAKPFSREFDEQLDACEMLYGGFSFQANFTSRDVEEVLVEFKGIYEEKILERIYEVMRLQLRKYAYLW